MDVAAQGEALLPAPLLNGLDGRFQTSNFTNFFTFLQNIPAEGDQNNFYAHRNFGVMADVIRYLEETNAQIVKAASLKWAELDAFHRSEMAILIGKYQQPAFESESRSEGKIQELSSSLENISIELSEARAELSSMKGRLSIAESELQDHREAVQMIRRLLDKENTRINFVIKRLETSLKDSMPRKWTVSKSIFVSSRMQDWPTIGKCSASILSMMRDPN